MRNIRSTSVEAYKNIIESGYLSTVLIKVFHIIFRYGPLTSRVANHLFIGHYDGDDNLNQLRSKISMLQDLGVVTTNDKVKCPVTNKNVYQFDVTGRMPVKPKRVTLADKKNEMLATLIRLDEGTWPWCAIEIDNLKQQINNL